MPTNPNTGFSQRSIENRFTALFLNERFTSFLIVLAVAMAFTSDFFSASVLYALNWGLLLYFSLEAFTKITVFSWGRYIKSGSNKFDFCILVISFFILLSPMFEAPGVAYLRMFRAITLLRVFRLIPNAEHILRGLAKAIIASRAILILMAIMLVFFSMLGFSLFSNYLPEFFGNPLTAMNTIFQIFTIENWGAAPEAAKAIDNPNIYYAINLFVIMVLILGGFIALSLANAVFVDEMVSDNNDDLRQEIKALRNENKEIKELLIKLSEKND